MAKFKLRGPDGGTYAITADTPEAAHAALYGTQAVEAPKSEPPVVQDNQKQTEDLPWYTKTAKALAFGATQTRSKDVDTLRKSGSVGFDLDKLDRTTDWMKQEAGLQNYDPASAHFADSSKPWSERIGYLPRTLLEGIPSMAQHVAASTLAGPIGMLGSTALTEGGSSVNRVREADKTDPNAELTTGQKMRVGGNVLTQAILNELGGRATLGVTVPVKSVGMEGVKQAAGNVVKAAGVDAFVGGYGAGVDKALIEGKEPSVADVALPAVAGAAVGTAFRAPGAAREAAVATRFRSLGELNPQSRGEVADLLQRYDGSFKATEERLSKDLDLVSKGLDGVSKELITDAKIKIKNGQRLDPTDIEAVGRADPEAARVLQNLDTFSVMKGLDNGGVSASPVGRLLNPFQRAAHGDVATTLGRFAEGASIGHAFWAHDPTTAAAVLGGQALGTAGLKGIDAITGASNPARVITDRFAGTASPTQTIAEARASAFATDLAERQAKASAAKAELDAAKTNQIATRLEGDIGNLATKRVKQLATDRKAESDRLWKEAAASVRALNKRDDLQAREERRVDTGIRQQADIMRRSQAVEESRLAAEQREQDAAMRRQADIMRNSQRVEEQRLSQLLSDIGQQIRIQKNSESASSTPAALPLAVARLRAKYEKEADAKAEEARVAAEAANAPPPPEPTYNPEAMEWGPSSSLAGTPAARAITATKALERHNRKVAKDEAAAQKKEEKQKKEAAQAKAAKRVKEAEAKTEKATEEADPNLHIFKHLGYEIKVEKEKVGDIRAYERQTKQNLDDRRSVINKAKDMTKDQSVRKLLDQLERDWNTRAKNKRDKAYEMLEDLVNDKRMPADVGSFLFDMWDSVKGTW